MGSKFSIAITLLITCITTPTCCQVVFTELMFDPTPEVGLPNAEYIEIYNISTDTIFLEGWTIADAASTKELPSDTILPQSYTLLVDNDDVDFFNGIALIPVSRLPSLNNSGDVLTLKNHHGSLVDQMEYRKDWHHLTNKDDGGYSLEKGSLNFCHSKNDWGTSPHQLGGTPGKANSYSTTTTIPPHLLSVLRKDDSIYLALSAAPALSLEINSSAFFINGKPVDTFLIHQKEVIIPNDDGKTLEIKNFLHCDFSSLDTTLEIKTITQPQEGEIVINEILFDPDRDGIEYLELFNISSKTFLCSDLVLQSKNENGGLKSTVPLSDQKRALLPGQYLVLCDNAMLLQFKHTNMLITDIIEMNLPALTNSFGHFELLFQNQLIDSVQYSPDYHTTFYDNTKGIALERINLPSDGLLKDSWQSSSSSSSYSTPGRVNSQNSTTLTPKISLKSKSFSPNGDFYKDALVINIEQATGYACTIKFYDAHGQLVKDFVELKLLGSEEDFLWEGKDNDNQQCSAGLYIMMLELFHPSIKTQTIKEGFAIEY